MKALRLVALRLILGSLTLLLVSIFVFAAVDMMPGDAAGRILGRLATEENREILRERLNLNAPPLERYLAWLGDLATGDLGRTLASDRPIADVLAPRVKNTLILAAAALLLYVPLVTVPAIIQATRSDTLTDHLISVIILVIYSIPDYLLGTLLLLLFVVMLPWLPATSLVDSASTWSELGLALILPAVTLAIVMAAYAVRMLRDSLVEILQSDFVRFATLNGLPFRRVVLFHALPNALVPTINVTALNLGYLIGGVVVVEKVFSFPGFGSLLVDALLLRDLPLIQTTVMIAAATYIAANFLADSAAVFLNPRLRT